MLDSPFSPPVVCVLVLERTLCSKCKVDSFVCPSDATFCIRDHTLKKSKAVSVLGALKEIPSLMHLTVDLEYNNLREACGETLGSLKASPSLLTLKLMLKGNYLGALDMQALAALRGAPALHTLILDLGSNRLDAEVVEPLVMLKEAPCLQHLGLFLPFNNLCPKDVASLAGLQVTCRLSCVCPSALWRGMQCALLEVSQPFSGAREMHLGSPGGQNTGFQTLSRVM